MPQFHRFVSDLCLHELQSHGIMDEITLLWVKSLFLADNSPSKYTAHTTVNNSDTAK